MKRIWERVVSLSKADRQWDIRFWQAQGPTMRFIAAWQMIWDFYKIRGKRPDARKFRLQRSVQHIEQIPR